MRVIFLDVDGVLVACPGGEYAPPTFTPRCVDAFRLVLAAAPNAKVVFASTWRLPLHVDRLHQQWLAHGFPEALAIDGTPDLRGDMGTPRRLLRGMEIQAWLDAHPDVRSWVVIDDDRMAIEPVLGDGRCVFTNPARGLTEDDAERAAAILVGSAASVR